MPLSPPGRREALIAAQAMLQFPPVGDQQRLDAWAFQLAELVRLVSDVSPGYVQLPNDVLLRPKNRPDIYAGNGDLRRLLEEWLVEDARARIGRRHDRNLARSAGMNKNERGGDHLA